jgi:hypothetical protein
MHYNFLFNGCSWTFGSELEGIEDDRKYQNSHRFSHLVSKHFDKSYDNISIPGSNNDLITEDTIQWFEDGNTCDLAIIQFTVQVRTTYYDDNGKRFILTPYDNNAQFVKQYYETFYTNFLGYQNKNRNIFILEQYLNNKNIPYIFIHIEHSHLVDGDDNKYYKDKGWINYLKTRSMLNLLSLLDKKLYYCKKVPNIMKNEKIKYFGGTHPNELGHQKIAECLINEINKNQQD